MDVEAPCGLLRFFEELGDPRMNRTKLHSLSDILVITICAVRADPSTQPLPVSPNTPRPTSPNLEVIWKFAGKYWQRKGLTVIQRDATVYDYI